MIRKILKYLDNKKELEEIKDEYLDLREVLLFNLRTSDRLVADIRGVLDSNEYGGKYDKKAKIIEFLNDFELKKL